MKFKVGDTVKITTGKDKGKIDKITRVLPKQNKVVVENANSFTKHVKPMMGQPGQRVELQRPLPTAKIAILNENEEVDRIGYRQEGDEKVRIFKKTGTVIPEPEVQPEETE